MIIGRDYKKAFNSAYKLIESGLLADNKFLKDQGIRIDPRDKQKIHHGCNEYQYMEEDSRYDDINEATFTEDGASWFEGIRKGNVLNENAQWINFLSSLASEYHKKYSLMEYNQRQRNQAELQVEEREGKELINKIVALFMPHLGEIVEWSNVKNNEVDLYGVSLRIEISGGNIPEPVPVLCKVYFRRNNKGSMVPLEGRTAENIEKSIDAIGVSQGNSTITIGTRIIDDTLRSLNDLVNNDNLRKTGVSLIKCLCCSKEDKKAIIDIRRKTSNSAAKFECRSIKVLGVSHVKWYDQTLDAFIEQKPTFRATLGINQTISMQCLNCSDEVSLISENIITYSFRDSMDNIIRKRVTLNRDAKNFGLSDQEIQDIKTSVFERHLIPIKCPENPRKSDCQNLRCAEQLEEFLDAKGNKIYKCSNCRYPEIIYKNTKGQKLYTPNLMLASDADDLMDKNELVRCKCCRRYFTRSERGIAEGHKICAFCTTASTKDSALLNEARARFKRYAWMFPTWSRMFKVFADKLCFEDDEILLFVIGDTKYKVDKIAINDFGYIKNPQKIN